MNLMNKEELFEKAYKTFEPLLYDEYWDSSYKNIFKEGWEARESSLKELKLLVCLTVLHERRKEMSHASLYHAQYEEEAIKLNKELIDISGKNYIDYTSSEIALALRCYGK
jgi:hypothetical protein